MTVKARELLEKYDFDTASAFDLSIVIVGYIRNTSDAESVQMNVLEGALHKWTTALAKKEGPATKRLHKHVATNLGDVMETLERLREELVDE
jgi:hypothetical protein